MRIVQIVLPGASEYERKAQRADQAALTGKADVAVMALDEAARESAGMAHVYATGEIPASAFAGFPLPYVASADIRKTRLSFRTPAPPAIVVAPLGETDGRHQLVPEAVEERYFENPVPPMNRRMEASRTIGAFARPSVRRMIEQTLARVERFRSDVTWTLYDRVPAPEDLAGVDIWVDPAADEGDYDGFVAEALVVGLPVVASRTPINVLRLEQGRTGMLVPPSDPNEMTHAILAALFKPEVCEPKRVASRQTISKFRARNRLRVLLQVYEQLNR